MHVAAAIGEGDDGKRLNNQRDLWLHLQSSRAKGIWHFPRGKGLAEKRNQVFDDGVARVKAAMIEEAAISGKPAPEFTDDMFITAEEQLKLCAFYEVKIGQYCKILKYDQDGGVEATALTFFKRFFLTHTIMDHDPKLMLLTCVFLAAKVENSHIPIHEFLLKIKSPPPQQMILDLEWVLVNGLEFQFNVQHLKWPLHGFFLDMQAYLLKKHENSKSKQATDDLNKLAETYKLSRTHASTSLRTDLTLTHYPSQVAMACLVLAATERGFRHELELYITYRLETWGGADPARIVDFKILLDEIGAVIRGYRETEKPEASAIDAKLQGCKNPAFNPDSRLFVKRKREEDDEKEQKRLKKVKREMEANSASEKALSSIFD